MSRRYLRNICKASARSAPQAPASCFRMYRPGGRPHKSA
jgi:hypothetical protein